MGLVRCIAKRMQYRRIEAELEYQLSMVKNGLEKPRGSEPRHERIHNLNKRLDRLYEIGYSLFPGRPVLDSFVDA